MAITAWLVLRITYALLFLYPIKGLVTDWTGTKQLVGILTPYYQGFLSIVMIAVMVIGGLGIAFGIYSQLAAILLFFYCLFGVVIHYRLAKEAQQQTLFSGNSSENIGVLKKVQDLAVIGNLTSAQKNVVLASMALFFVLIGTGPASLTPLLW